MPEPTKMRITGPDGNPAVAEVLEFRIEREDWAAYRLEDGTTLRAKLTVLKIGKVVDAEGNVIYKPDGEPYYFASHKVEIVADVPEHNMKRGD